MLRIAHPGWITSVVVALLAVGCRSPSPASSAPASTPSVTVSVPATSADAPADPEPEKPPWDRLLALQAVFSGGAPEPPCPADRAARVVVTGGDEGTRVALAEEAGCVGRSPVTHGEVQLCCPTGLAAPSPNRTGGGKSCEEAQQEYVASSDSGTGKDGPDVELTAGIYGAVLNRGSYLNACNVQATWGVSVCAAIQDGAVVGVTVRTTPASIATADCIATKVREIIFPPSPKMDITRTTFAPSE